MMCTILCASTHYVVRERPSSDESFYAGFQEETHVQAIIKHIRSGELVDQHILREAFIDFLTRHQTFGFEIDHKALKCYFKNLKLGTKKLKAKL